MIALLLALALAATPRPAPPELLVQLRALTTRDWCQRADWTEASPLGSEQFVSRADGSLVVFLQVPDYFCRDSNTAVPAVVDSKGRWKWGVPIEGLVTVVASDAGGALWAVTQWQIEGTYPMLWRSSDGLAWTRIELPAARPTAGPDEQARALCFCATQLRVELEGGEGDGGAPARTVLARGDQRAG